MSLAALAERLGVKAPVLYKYVDGIRRPVAPHRNPSDDRAVGRDLGQVRGGRDQRALHDAPVLRCPIPGRYYATTGAQFQGRDDPLFAAATRVIDSIQAVLSGYGIRPDELDHAIRMLRCMIHGYTLLQAANGFQWSNDPDESVVWMIRFVNAGLTAVGDNCS